MTSNRLKGKQQNLKSDGFVLIYLWFISISKLVQMNKNGLMRSYPQAKLWWMIIKIYIRIEYHEYIFVIMMYFSKVYSLYKM